jgi:hypothetical protein
VRRGRLLTAAVAAAVVLGGGASGCTQLVAGSAAASPPKVPTGPGIPPPATTRAQATPAPAGPRSALVVDPIADECLLNASEFGALVGGAVRPPAEATVDRGDGSTGSSCVVTAGSDPIAMINVYGVRSGTPADYVRAGGVAGRRDLPGVGETAAVFDTAAGPTLQVAAPKYLVTILVSGRTPTDDAWRAAATAALSRLPT